MASTAVKAALGFVVGAAIGGMGMGVVSGAAAYAMLKKAESDIRAGWRLAPVVVAAEDVPAGATLTFDQISQRSIPEQLITSSVVKPDSASYVVNQKLLAPVMAGEPLRWAYFATVKELADRELATACSDAFAGTAPPPTLDALKKQVTGRKHK